MKRFCITYTQTVIYDTEVWAENEREAKKKFKEVLPYEKIDKVWEINEESYA